MKVALVGPYPSPGDAISGGVERVIDTLLRDLSGYADLTLIVPNSDCDRREMVAGVPVIYLKRTRGPAVLRYWTTDAQRLAKVIHQVNPDIVHYQGVAGISRATPHPAILTIHGIAHQDILFRATGSRFKRALIRMGAKMVERVEHHYRQKIGHVIVINPYVETMLPDIAHLHSFPIPNPLDRIYVDTPLTPQKRPRRIISAGRIGARKQTVRSVAISARVLAADPTAQARFFGSPDSASILEECQKIARDFGVSERLTFPGNIDATALRQELDNASVFLMTSQQETAPVAISEAHARGVAVVAPNAFGIKSMLEDGHNGFFLPDQSLNDQSKLLTRALNHPWDRDVITAQAHITYGPKEIGRKTIKAYQDILDRA